MRFLTLATKGLAAALLALVELRSRLLSLRATRPKSGSTSLRRPVVRATPFPIAAVVLPITSANAPPSHQVAHQRVLAVKLPKPAPPPKPVLGIADVLVAGRMRLTGPGAAARSSDLEATTMPTYFS